MAERLHPGVYVEEISGGVRPIEGVSTSTAAFIGQTARGVPGQAHFLTSFAEFQRSFGGHQPGEAGVVAQAVDAFFGSGGKRAYLVRILPANALPGLAAPILTRQGGTLPSLVFHARGAGAWSSQLRVNITAATNFPEEAFRVEVQWSEAGATRTVEAYDDVRMDSAHEDYVVDRINEVSRYVRVVDAYAQALDSAAPGTVLIAAQAPALRSRTLAAATDTFTLFAGNTLQLSTWDMADATGARTTLSISVTEASVAAAIPTDTPAFSNGRVALTPAQLSALIARAITDAGTGSPFTVEAPNDTSVQISVRTATAPVLTVAAPGAGGTWDLDGETVTVTVDGVARPVTIAAADLEEVTPAELQASLQAGLGDHVASVTVAPDDSIVITGRAAAAGGTLAGAVAPTAGALDFDATAGAPGLAATAMDGIRMSLSEALSPTVPPVLRTLGFPPKSRGYVQNASANPLARPALTTGLRLLGGTDGSGPITAADFSGDERLRTGLHALDGVDVNLVALPGKNDPAYLSVAIAYCDNRGDCFLIADGPGGVQKDFAVAPDDAKQFIEGLPSRSKNAAMFYPWVRVPDPVGVGRNPTRLVPPCGHVAGIFARTDSTRGVWKAPAGIEATLPQTLGLQYPVIDQEQDLLNPVSLNCLRQFPGVGIVSWGSRTLSSDPEWRYIPVRRTALFLKESVRRGLRWAVFEPNDQELWDRIRINIEAFMLGLFRQGAFQGATPEEAFLVACDRSTNPQELVDAGIVTAQLSFAPLKPAEFVVIQISQKSLLASASGSEAEA